MAVIPSLASPSQTFHQVSMTILLPALAVAFAAFCVWLTVRIVNRRERWAKWTLAAMFVLPSVYVLSIGPAAWLVSNRHLPKYSLAIYRPLGFVVESSEMTSGAISRYIDFWVGPPLERIEDSIEMQ
jgi:hypothetical protein